MRLVSKKAHLFLAAVVLILAGSSIESVAQGKGRGGENRGGERQQRMERPQTQRQERRFEQRQMPQFNRQAQRQQQPRTERPPQMNRQAQQQQRQFPQIQRQERPQWNRRFDQGRTARAPFQRNQGDQRQRPQSDRQFQTRDRGNFDRGGFVRSRQDGDRSRSNIIRVPRQNDSGDGRARVNGWRSRSGDGQNAIQRRRGDGRDSRFENRRADIQSQISDRRGGGSWRRGRQNDGNSFRERNGDLREFQNERGRWRDRESGQRREQGDNFGWWRPNNEVREYRGERGHRDRFDFSRVDVSGFRDQERAWRRWARNEGRSFDERDFRRSVWEYRQREAWRDNVIRSVISLNFGYANDYYYIPPPQYPAYYGVNYEPWRYNIGYTYYDPNYNGFYVQPQYYAYRPYDNYYATYSYDDPYNFDDPYDDYVTDRIFRTASSGGIVTRLLGGLLAYGYDQGYRDGLNARQAGYDSTEYYSDPFVYYYNEPSHTTVTYYQPYLYGGYEDRHCLSEGYQLGYEDAYSSQYDYDPYYGEANINVVSIFVGTTWQIS